jgi:hypothetical protein
MLKHETLGDGGKVTWGKVTGGFRGNFTSENPAKSHLVLTLVENRILKTSQGYPNSEYAISSFYENYDYHWRVCATWNL